MKVHICIERNKRNQRNSPLSNINPIHDVNKTEPAVAAQGWGINVSQTHFCNLQIAQYRQRSKSVHFCMKYKHAFILLLSEKVKLVGCVFVLF